MAFVDKYVEEFIRIEIALLHARSRLVASTDPEALHDLRICVRRIRSLLTPLRSSEQTLGIRSAASDVGALTTPARDLEVMIEELERQGFPEQANRRRSRLGAEYRKVMEDSALNRLFEALDQLPMILRSIAGEDGARTLESRIGKSLTRHVDKLHLALDDPQFDRHVLRILVKRTRYLTDAFPQLSPLSTSAARSLKAVQGALGSWHDHFQWCLKAQIEPDLLPLERRWAKASAQELALAEIELKQLTRLLPEVRRKKLATPKVTLEEVPL
jgi:CHAD domain-containing protein